jgi:hypothetical protein
MLTFSRFCFEHLAKYHVERHCYGGKQLPQQLFTARRTKEETAMIQNNGRIRGLAIVTGGVLAASALLVPAPAQADKSDTLKIGATVLGAAAAVLAAKGKTVPAVIAGAAGYYAYKKGRDEDRKKNDYPYYGQAGTYPQYPANNSNYPSNNYPTYGSYPTNNYPTNNYPTNSYPANYPSYDYPSNSYPTYQQPANYPSYQPGYGNSGNTGYNGTYNGGYNGGYDSYPNSYRAVAPQSAAPAPRSNQRALAPNVVLR